MGLKNKTAGLRDAATSYGWWIDFSVTFMFLPIDCLLEMIPITYQKVLF